MGHPSGAELPSPFSFFVSQGERVDVRDLRINLTESIPLLCLSATFSFTLSLVSVRTRVGVGVRACVRVRVNLPASLVCLFFALFLFLTGLLACSLLFVVVLLF